MASNHRYFNSPTNSFRVLCLTNQHSSAVKDLQGLFNSSDSIKIHILNDLQSLKSLLAKERWDAILSEFKGSDWNIFAILDLVNIASPNMPVISIGSNVSGEEVSSFMQHSSAHQYIESQNIDKIRDCLSAFQKDSRPEGQSTQTLFNTIGIVSNAPNEQIVEANDVFLEMLGYTRADLSAGRLNWQSLTPPSYRHWDEEALQQLLKYGKAVPVEKSLIDRNGQEVPVLVGTAFLDTTQNTGLSFVLELPCKETRNLSQEKQILFLQAMDACIIGAFRWHLNGQIVETNQTFLNMLGFTREDISKEPLNWKDLTPPEYKPRDEEAVRLLQEHGEAGAFEKQYYRKDGSRVDILIGRLYCEPDTVERGMAFVLDISRYKSNERALEEIQSNLLNAQRIANLGSWDCNLITMDYYYSEEFYRIVGAPNGTSFNTKESYLPYVHPEDYTYWVETLKAALKEQDKYTMEYRILRSDGEVRYVFAHGEIERNDLNEPIRTSGILQDITDRRKTEEALMLLSSQQEALFNNISDLLWMKDTELRFIDMNEPGLNFLSRKKEEVLGKKFSDFIPQKQAERHHESDLIVLQTRKSVLLEDCFAINGESVWLEVIKSPIINSQGEAIGLTGTARDITKRKQDEEAMLKSNELLEKKVTERTLELETAYLTLKETEQLRATFVSALTHDLRTPLIAQKRLTELLLEQCKEDSGQLAFLSKGLMQNNENLLDMVNKLLETYQYAEGKIMLQSEFFDLFLLVEECYDTLREVAKTKEIQLVNKLTPQLMALNADRSLMKRVLINLLGNALENISHGCTVEIRASISKDTVQVEVSDNGPGIETEFLPHMFDRYSTRSRRRQKLGSGLGLFICKTIVELHQGNISISSGTGQGATFVIRLPRPVEQKQSKKSLKE